MKKSHKIAVVLSIVVLIGLIAAAIAWSMSANEPETNTVTPEAQGTQPETYSLSEVRAHNTPEDCWAIIDGDVYDITGYIQRHPGGAEITRACGIDATSLFNERQTSDGEVVGSGTPHSENAARQLETFKIGTVEQ